MKTSSEQQPQIKLRMNANQCREGTMFGPTQFCYANKPGGAEPGFRAIDLNDAFFVKFQERLGINSAGSLAEKQASFINLLSHLNDKSREQLCQDIKKAVATSNNSLTAWMYKFDYPQQGAKKSRLAINKEALREFVATSLAQIFSDKNQQQKICWVPGPKGPQALVGCAWKTNLTELTAYIHGHAAPNYNGVLVEDIGATVKKAIHLPGLGKNLIFGLALGDRDGIGKDGQNKGIADGVFYGFDYGKCFERTGVCKNLQDDFRFDNPGASSPKVFRGTGPLGLLRHIMYRNYSIFYDTALSERMEGVHILKKMITGQNPSADILASYPELGEELRRIDAITPSVNSLLDELDTIKSNLPVELLADLVAQIHATQFERYFAQIKINLIKQTPGISLQELKMHLKTIDKWAIKTAANNKQILKVFNGRLALTKENVDLLDQLEKIFSPASDKSQDNQVLLNHLRITDPQKRKPFQLKKENGQFVLTTKDKTLQPALRRLGITCTKTKDGLSAILSPKELNSFRRKVNNLYQMKKIYPSDMLPLLQTWLNHKQTAQVSIKYKWQTNNRLSIRLTPKTEIQAKKLQGLFGLKTCPKPQRKVSINIDSEQLLDLKTDIEKLHARSIARPIVRNRHSPRFFANKRSSLDSSPSFESSLPPTKGPQ